MMSNDPYTDGAVNNQQPRPDTGAAPEWNGGYAPQQPQQQWQGYMPQQPEAPHGYPQQPDMNQGYPQPDQQSYAPQQPQQQWNGGYAPQQPQQHQWNQGYPPQQTPYQGGYQDVKPPRQHRVPRKANPANNVVKLPRFIDKEKLPAIVQLLLYGFAGIMLMILINGIVHFNAAWAKINAYYGRSAFKALAIIADILVLGGAVCLVLGQSLKKPLLSAIGTLTAGGGMLLAAIGHFFVKPYSLGWMNIIGAVLLVFAAAALVLVGLNYLLHGRGINAVIKRIACYVGLGCGVVGTLLCLIPTFSYFGEINRAMGMNSGVYSVLYSNISRDTYSQMRIAGNEIGMIKSTGTVLWAVFSFLGAAVLSCALFLYNPDMPLFQEKKAKAEKAPVQMWRATSIAQIMACVFAGCAFVGFIFSIICFKFSTFFAMLLWLAAGVMMVLGVFLRRKCELLYAIGMFLAAAGVITFMLADSWYLALILCAQFLCVLGLGFHYLFKGTVINDKRKKLLTFVGLGIAAAASVFHIIMQFVDTSSLHMSLDAIALILNLFVMFSAVALFLAVFFYRPFSGPSSYPNQYQNAYPNNYGNGYPNGYGNGYDNSGYNGGSEYNNNPSNNPNNNPNNPNTNNGGY